LGLKHAEIEDMKSYSLFKAGCFAILFSLLSSCSGNQQFTAGDAARVGDGVASMMKNIENEISAKGPIAWLDYFEDTPGFFMASGGQLALKDYSSAVTFVKNNLVKMMPRIKLRWKDVRIDPLSNDLATAAAGFHEDISLANGKTMSFDGYFTATAHFDGHAWKLRNLHWSILPPVAA
jgi:hypothetical protein